MQDRFRFRVWLEYENKMISPEDENADSICFFAYNQHGNLLKFVSNNEVIWARIGHTIYDEHIMQCTGLKDKNGRLIYEGDILKDKYGALHPISWNIKGFYEADTFAVAGFYNAIQEDMKVIGNIYENKELLTGAEN